MRSEVSEEYRVYIKDHVLNVQKGFLWFHAHGYLSGEMVDKVFDLVKVHDVSKYSSEEFEPYALHFYGNELEKEASSADFDKAWEYHKQRNPHHWEYWVFKTGPQPMDEDYVVEMVCDWWSFSWKKGDLEEIFSWYEKNRPKMELHPDTEALVDKYLALIREGIAYDGTNRPGPSDTYHL